MLIFQSKSRLIFLFLHASICCGYSLEAPQQGASNEYPQLQFSLRNKKKYLPDTNSYLDLWPMKRIFWRKYAFISHQNFCMYFVLWYCFSELIQKFLPPPHTRTHTHTHTHTHIMALLFNNKGSWVGVQHYFGYFWFGFYSPFKNNSLKLSQSFIKGGWKPENWGKNHLTICKQNLAFQHVTQARLEPHRWET